ncbi:hypothetical protein GCM10011391_16160 [Pullulanibacillus camelliae]|uniref:BCE-2095-like N-terminal domain-containing protein n=1 Tax=Pullulanibacillus camelliae TaxID=1707096 RepID=A0A8J2VM88_9BACL|nr:hypothetical protein [Pullulanibacillus camelliae]GGE38111.1 hypothetical protein GCM10011391_16160 [Pullulanibacillus camelliae]
MTEHSFIQIQKQMIDLTFAGDFEGILTLIDNVEQDYPNHWNQLYFWKASVLSTLGHYSQALTVLKSALDKGCWWQPQQLQEATDLYPLHQFQEFQAIMKTCQQLSLSG